MSARKPYSPKTIGRKRETTEITIEVVRRLALPALLERLGQVTRTSNVALSERRALRYDWLSSDYVTATNATTSLRPYIPVILSSPKRRVRCQTGSGLYRCAQLYNNYHARRSLP